KKETKAVMDFMGSVGAEFKTTEEADEKWSRWCVDKTIVNVFRFKGDFGNAVKLYNFPTKKGVPPVDKLFDSFKEGEIVTMGVDYMLNVLKLLKSMGHNSVELRVKTDYPMMMKTDNFEIIIAPRVED
ncbi:hypothetical protein HQ529_03470, partial [Candidatus Woesearchaeota archaeon]|nr:hypothetical protein [Candidatus Woesearchaeota archaeon]